MPSVKSSSRPKVWDSSTVMTPSLPTLSIASAISSPTCLSWADRPATAAMSSLESIGRAEATRSSETALTAASMPFFRAAGEAPAATLRRPSRTSAWASTVAVVVPSPAMSLVLVATSFTSCAPRFSYGSSTSTSRAMVTPSLVMVGAPNFLSMTTLRPLGPIVTFTVSASLFDAALEGAAGVLVELQDLRHGAVGSSQTNRAPVPGTSRSDAGGTGARIRSVFRLR